MAEKKLNLPLRVKIKLGTLEFEVECREEQLQAIIEKILVTVGPKLKETLLSNEKKVQLLKGKTCKGVIQRLWEEKWFSVPKTVGEVHIEMAKRGYHYDRSAVAHALMDLVKDGILVRDGEPRRYRYTQRRTF